MESCKAGFYTFTEVSKNILYWAKKPGNSDRLIYSPPTLDSLFVCLVFFPLLTSQLLPDIFG